MKVLFFTLIFIYSCGNAFAAGNGYLWSRSIVINHSNVGASDQTQFPIMICANGAAPCNITITGLNQSGAGAKVQNASGFDIIFTSDAGCVNKLTWEMEKYVAATGEVEAWVTNTSVPLSHTTNTIFYICYDNASISTVQSTASSVWDSSYSAVWHMSNNAASGTISDSTTHTNTATLNVNTSTLYTASGKVDGAYVLNGTSDLATITDSSTLQIANVRTVEGWAFLTAQNTGISSPRLLVEYQSTTQVWSISFPMSSTDINSIVFSVQNGATLNNLRTPANGLSISTWYHIVCETDGTTVTHIYLNGVDQTLVAASGTYSFGVTVEALIGGRNDAARWFPGDVDESRISTVQRSAAYVTTEYNNINSPSTFFNFGTPVGDGPNSYSFNSKALLGAKMGIGQ